MSLKCDLQYGTGDARYKLSRVGVRNVHKPVIVKREGLANRLNGTLNCSFDIYVDLPADQKGSHMSRNVDVINEVVSESLENPVPGLEILSVDICRRLLVHHEYAKHAEVHITAEYFKPNKTPLGRDTFETYTLYAGGDIVRDGPLTTEIGISAVGMSACPCAQQTVTEMLGYSGDMPVMTHNQRNVCTLKLTLPEGVYVEAEELIDLVEDSFSSPTFELLKRPDEGQVVINAHRNTKFVEDVARGVLERVVARYPDLPDDAVVNVVSDSEESIHKHDAYAERTATMGELRQENM